MRTAPSIEPVLHSFSYSLDYLREQLADVSPADMVKKPPGVSNHPAWTVGHLAFVSQMIGQVAGVAEFLPSDWAARYGPGSSPAADAHQYHPKDELLAMLTDAESRLTDAIRRLSDSDMDAAFPAPEYLEVFPTIRHALTQVLVGHTAFHVGQISVWRKAMGLPPMRRSYE